MTKLRQHLFAAAVSALTYFSSPNSSVEGNIARNINILNESGKRLEIFWIHPDTGELVLQTTPYIMDGTTFPLNSFVGHSFEVREMPNSRTGECGYADEEEKTCRSAFFTVNPNDSQAFFIKRGVKIVQEDNISSARDSAAELMSHCQEKAFDDTRRNRPVEETIKDLIECSEQRVTEQLIAANEEIAFQARIRKKMGEKMENYTCADEGMTTTTAIRDETWLNNGYEHTTHILHDHFDSHIHLIEDLITPEECNAMETAAAATLHRASVADGKGGSEVSASRKAMQAGITVPWHEEAQGNGIASVSRKIYNYVNHVLDLDINEFGQEDLMSIQYSGRGDDDPEPDRYTPHCDGQCDGIEFKSGNRMATVLLYCDVPTRGGATNFRNANIHVVPQPGNAVFFSYLDPVTMKTDSGFTEHSGCPVIEGEKKIVTQWIRLGVDSENPWDSFNTLGVKRDAFDE
mmetsp:Transcript_15709/g.15110  ORF Transcript_15709/g.15110 Transcript_15709/m.15110 type:complete len:461 (-) Transcript_15709:73-1455(-)|eukprot:CAMPEP_0197833384 /NCGR_PEP_ID=MMETSP1437-20131217/18863_1 /TAXON_ID=49252 ORGANISM="Eucampia antarctica, Strain CCMP1452" /NCGR_SAMPLE_ID=MMETSP1437 /ASSEMBLY_ACC=CAM_ASM_001096 /LENGTH=460 /DNA_ID=CAMNT_0043437409 /DNA_START=89 /DNA_END=1471 /DNA_ORIENTATION=+